MTYSPDLGLMLGMAGVAIGLRIGWWLAGKLWPDKPEPVLKDVTPRE